MIIATVDKNLRIPGQLLKGKEIREIAGALTIPNPDLAKAKRELLAFSGPDELQLWETTDSGDFVLPRGFARHLEGYMDQDFIFDDQRYSRNAPPWNWRVEKPLRAYQEVAVQKIMLEEQGIYQAPPGAGKTAVVLDAIRRSGEHACVIVNSTHIAEQWKIRAQEHYKINSQIFGDGMKFAEGYALTIALAQTLWSQFDKLAKWFNKFGFVCLDECHHAPATSFYKIIQEFPAKYRIGVSATPFKNQDLGFLAVASLGPVFHKTTKQDLVEAGVLVIPEVHVIHTAFAAKYWPTHHARRDGSCGYKYCTRHGKRHGNNYNDVMAKLTKSKDRNLIVTGTIKSLVDDERRVLVLSRRKEHLAMLRQILKVWRPHVKTYMLTGDESRLERTDVYHYIDMQPGVVFSTLGDEAMDIPKLDSVVLAYPARNTDLVRQQVGRIERFVKGKKTPRIIDFMDDLAVLRSQLADRAAMYEDEGYPLAAQP